MKPLFIRIMYLCELVKSRTLAIPHCPELLEDPPVRV